MLEDSPQAVRVLHCLSPSPASQQTDVFCGIGGSQALFPLFPVVSVVAVDGEEQGWGWLGTALAARGSFPWPREPSAATGAEEPCCLPA